MSKNNKGIKTLVAVLFVVLCLLLGFLIYSLNNKESITTMYLASDNKDTVLYDGDLNQVSLTRGKEVSLTNKTKELDGQTLYKIYYDDNVYYIDENSLVSDKNDCVLEKELWAYRTCSVYENSVGEDLNGLLNKGDKIKITGHSEVLEDGSVNRYGFDGGYVNSKYLTSDEGYASSLDDSSYASYMQTKTSDDYGAGSASGLDYYYNEKPVFEDNVMPDVCKSLYINMEALKDIEDYIELAKQTSVNTFVIDIRDAHIVTFKSDVMKEYSPTSYEAAYFSKEDFKAQIDKVKEAGIYMVARITVFKDKNFMIDHPEYAILDKGDDNKPFEYGGSYWPSAYKREVWEYNVKLSKEVVELGFNEIQFDYVRFPEQIDYYADVLDVLDLQNEYNETRSQAIQRFLMYACDELHDVHAYVSADVFGETSNDYVCAYGQYWPAISNVVDVISPMPYPDHFLPHSYNIEEIVWEVPYKLLSAWGKQAMLRQNETTSPAKVRTYIQGYDSIYEPFVAYDNEKLKEQIDGLKDSGIYDNGYIVWNSGSYIDNYYLFKDALSE